MGHANDVRLLPALNRSLPAAGGGYRDQRCLRAALALDPEHVAPRLFEGLWDCEADVRRVAAEHGELTERLAFLEADPMEDEEVRAAARARLTKP